MSRTLFYICVAQLYVFRTRTKNQYGVRGGIEPAFMSTTLDRDVAMGYAAGDGSRMGLVLEVRQGRAAGQTGFLQPMTCACCGILPGVPTYSFGAACVSPNPVPLHPPRHGQPRRRHLVALAVPA